MNNSNKIIVYSLLVCCTLLLAFFVFVLRMENKFETDILYGNGSVYHVSKSEKINLSLKDRQLTIKSFTFKVNVENEFSGYIDLELMEDDGDVIYHEQLEINSEVDLVVAGVQKKLGKCIEVDKDKEYTLIINVVKQSKKGTIDIDTTGEVSTKKNTHGEIFVYLVIVLLAGFSSLYLYKIINKGTEIEKVFFVQATLVGIMITILLPPGTVPDECGHFTTVYSIIEKGRSFLFDDVIYEQVPVFRDGDMNVISYLNDYYVSQEPCISEYQELLNRFELVVDNPKWIKPSGLGPYFSLSAARNFFSYIPMIIGCILGLTFRLGTIPLMYLMRLSNFATYLILTYYAIKIIPYAKNVLFVFATLPYTLQFAFSMNYDAMNFAYCFVFIAIITKIYDKRMTDSVDKVGFRDLMLLIGACVLLFMTKHKLYCILIGSIVILFSEKLRIKEFAKENKKKFCLFIVIGVLICTSIICVYIMNNDLFTHGPMGEGAIYGNERCRSIFEILMNPINTSLILINTVICRIGDWLMTLGGISMSWDGVTVSMTPVIVVLTIASILLFTEIEENFFFRYEKIKKASIVCNCVGILQFVIILLSMLIFATPKRLIEVNGINPRYFLPVLALSFCFIHKKHITKIKNNMYTLLYGNASIIYILYLASEILER